MRKKLLSSLWFFLLIGCYTYGQNRTVTGTVTGKDDGLPLPGVSVSVKGTKFGTQTNTTGRFSLSIPENNSVLVFSFLGYSTQEVSATGNLNISLNPVTNQLNEVTITVPYGTANRETFVGSAASVSSKDLTNRPVTNPLSALAGVAPGIQVNPASGQPGGAPAIRVRGFGSINSSNDPLIIVDGVQYQGALNNINTEDIDNISVLKDASSTALYGAKAANGVIIVTTKRGRKGNSQFNVKATQGVIFRGIPEYDRVDAYQYYPLEWTGYRNSLVYATNNPLSIADANIIASGLGTRNANNQQVLNGRNYLDISQTLGALIVGGVYTQSNNPFNVPSTQIVDVNGKINPAAQLRYNDLDWLKETLRTSNRKEYTLNYSGGTDKTDYYTSVGYLNEKGFAKKSDFDRLTARLNVNTQATKWLKTGVNMNGTVSETNSTTTTSTSYVNPFFFSRNIGPVYNVYAHNPVTGANLYDALGNKIYDTGGLGNLGVPSRASGASPGRHVLQEILLNDNSFKRNLFSTRAYGEVSFLKYFKFTTNLSADYSNTYTSSYQNQIVGDGAPGGRATRTASFITTYNLNQLLNYSQTFDKHSVSVLAGHENYSRLIDVLDGSRNTQLLAGNTELANFTTTSNLTSYKDRDRSEGYFSQLNYDYDQKYLFSASVRRDGVSRFGSDVRWGTFGSAGAGWRVDRENFLRDVTWIDLLKIRSSFGTVGNYQTLDSNGNPTYYPYQSVYDINNNALEPGFSQNTVVGNPNLEWEVNKTLDVGIEFGLFKNKLSGSVEYYNRKSSNLLFLVPQPLSSGITSQYQNIGTMYNKGVEVNLAGEPVRFKNFSWNVNFNATTIKNRITKMPDGQPEIVTGTKKLAVGHSIYDFYLRQYAGVDPSDGSALYIPNDGATGTSIRTINGINYTTAITNAKLDYNGTSSIPDVYGALTNTFSYKGLSLSILINYQLGGKIYDSNYASLMSISSYGSALHKDILNSWMKPGDITDIPRIDQGNSTNLYAASSRWLTNASYLYFRNATLNYSLPNKFVSKISVKNARIYASGENLFLISGRKGMDPTQNFNGTVTNGYVPQRIISLGLNFSL
ncbi:SusC/RagA family TonB-linked outer membrane protein [Mucilaginibacter sp.]|uniref:SusC/RagA family TonB-linked outer membrane protein n=1 Tax=Mucilaginibacter sp. TaxID=1882438 RepID=UPI003B00F60E